MADLIIKPSAGAGNKLILQDQAGGAILTTADSGAVIANTTEVTLIEKAAANANVATKGEVWVKSTTPNTLFFTDDAGTDFGLGTVHAVAGTGITGDSLGVTAANDTAATLFIKADNSDDAGDDWTIVSNTNQTLTIENDIVPAPFTILCTLIPGFDLVTPTGGTSSLAEGMGVSGNNIPPGTTITFINSASTFNISANATAGGSSTLTFTASGVILTITPHATVASSDVAVAGGLTVDGGLTVTGTTTLKGSLTGQDSLFSIDMLDNNHIKLGTGDDMQLYYDPTFGASYVTSTAPLKLATETSGIAVTIGHTISETTIADNLTVTGNSTIGGTLGVTGDITIDANQWIRVGGQYALSGDGSGNTFLDNSGGYLSFRTLGTEIMKIDSSGLIIGGGVVEKIGTSTVSGTTVTVDLDTGNFFVFDLQSASGTVATFTISNTNATSGQLSNFIVKVIQGSTDREFNWGGLTAFKWPAATAPTLTTGNNKVDILSFTTYDNGTTWYGQLVGQDFS